MKIITITFALTGLLFLNAYSAAQSTNVAQANEFWNKAIEAKGGRDRLHSVKSLLVESSSKNHNDEPDFQRIDTTEVFLPPSRFWSCIDQRPGFPLVILQYDFQKEVGHEFDEKSLKTFSPRSTTPEKLRINSIELDGSRFNNFAKENFIEKQLIYLMETESLRPKISGWRREKVGKTSSVVVEASFGREQFEYFLDPNTYLPIKVRILTWINELSKSSEEEFFFSDYVKINGIHFPRSVSKGVGSAIRVKFEVNTKINKKLFDTLPSSTTGPESWKPSMREPS